MSDEKKATKAAEAKPSKVAGFIGAVKSMDRKALRSWVIGCLFLLIVGVAVINNNFFSAGEFDPSAELSYGDVAWYHAPGKLIDLDYYADVSIKHALIGRMAKVETGDTTAIFIDLFGEWRRLI